MLILRLIRIFLISALAAFAFPVQSADRTIQIVGGTVVPDARYPWMAAIGFRGEDDIFYPGCGGSLVSERWVLTAAHCFVDRDTGLTLDPNDVGALLGALDFTSGDGVLKAVSQIVVHPGYSRVSGLNDIALLELSVPIAAELLSLPNQVLTLPQDGELATVAGWGITEEGGIALSTVLQEVDLPVVSHNACLTFYPESLDQSTMVCAGGSQEGGRDSCQGDSGGPLFVPRGDGFVQAGIVSRGIGCGRAGIPGIYTRVAAYSNWIISFVGNPQIYNGADDDNVVAVAETVEVLAANSQISASVLTGGANLYQAPNVNKITLTTLRGDADLYVFNSRAFSQESLVCQSGNTTAIDECSLSSIGTYYIGVAGYEDSDYTLAASNGNGGVVQLDVVTLQAGVPVSGVLLKDTAAVYRATTGGTASLTSVAGNADLLVFSSDNFSVETLICASVQPGSSLDSCAYGDSYPEVYIGVYSVTDTTYSLTVGSSSTSQPVVVSQSDVASGGSSGGGGVSFGLLALLAFLTQLKYCSKAMVRLR